MRVNRRALRAVIILTVGYFAWQNLSQSSQETAVLHITTPDNRDLFATLWLVDDGQFTWLRAETRTRLWIDPLRDSEDIRLRRNGQTLEYSVRFYDDPETIAQVNQRFRVKYGLADQARGLLSSRDPLPIRLERL